MVFLGAGFMLSGGVYVQVLPHQGLEMWELHRPGLEAGPLRLPLLCFRQGTIPPWG